VKTTAIGRSVNLSTCFTCLDKYHVVWKQKTQTNSHVYPVN